MCRVSLSARKAIPCRLCGPASPIKRDRTPQINLSCAYWRNILASIANSISSLRRLASKWRRMTRRMAVVVCWTQRSATALRSRRKCLFSSGHSNREMNARSWPEKICETNSGGHTSTASPWSGSHPSRVEGRRREVESALIQTSISTRSTTAPISALEVPITGAPPSPGSRVPLAIAGSSSLQFFGIPLPGVPLFLAQDSEHRTTDAPPKGQGPRNRSQD